MSWQFNHLIGPQMAPIGTSISSATKPSISKKKDDAAIAPSTCNSTTNTITTITTTANKPNDANPTTDLNLSSKPDHQDCRVLKGHHQPFGETTQTRGHHQQQLQQHKISHKLLQQKDNMDQYNQQQMAASPFIDMGIAAQGDLKAMAGNSGSNAVTSLLSSGSSSLVEHLMPSDHHQSPPWSTYSMPIFPSFGADINYTNDEGATATNDQASLVSSKLNNNDSSKILTVGSNLFGRFNQLNSDNNANFSTGGGSVAAVGGSLRMNRQDNLLGSDRSYSNVLHSHQEIPIQGRLSMFAVQQQQQQQQQSHASDLNAANANSSTHSSLTPTNHHRQQAVPSSSSQYQQQQQTRRTNEFMSANHLNQQQSYQQAQYQQPGNSSGFNSGPNQHQIQSPNEGTSTLNPIGGNYFSRSATASNFNVDKQSSVISGSGTGSNNNGPNKRRNKLPFFTGSNVSNDSQNSMKVDLYGSALVNSDGSERFSRKVFVGGLPPDIDEEEIKASFRRFGSLIVDWPHKAESKSYFPPKGYAFLLFHEESSVQALIDACLLEDDKLYLCVSSPTIKDKPVQIRPWRLCDADFVLDSTLALDPRKTVFVGGVPRPLKASELANIMNNLYGGVCYAGIDTDPELKYPKGAGRVAFSSHQNYIAAISARFVHLHHSEIEKRVEVKPYVLDDQFCDECQGARCGNKFAPFFCANITCLQYYCENCWSTIHSQPGREFHKPLVKEGADRPRVRWC